MVSRLTPQTIEFDLRSVEIERIEIVAFAPFYFSQFIRRPRLLKQVRRVSYFLRVQSIFFSKPEEYGAFIKDIKYAKQRFNTDSLAAGQTFGGHVGVHVTIAYDSCVDDSYKRQNSIAIFVPRKKCPLSTDILCPTKLHHSDSVCKLEQQTGSCRGKSIRHFKFSAQDSPRYANNVSESR
jgi:hypothetical protein